jgi:hypothetical protein
MIDALIFGALVYAGAMLTLIWRELRRIRKWITTL